MLAKQNRITTSEMKALARPTARSHQSAFTLLYFAAPSGKKVAVVVAKKVSKKAVVRNRLRRQIYTHVATLFDTLPAGYYLVRVQPEVLSLSPKDVREQLSVAFGEISKAR